MKSSLAIFLGILLYSSISWADSEVHAVITTTPNRLYFFEDETILFDGSASWSDGGMIVQYTWKVDGVTVSTASSFSQAFPLASGQASKNVTVQLIVKDDMNDTGQKSITILIKRRPQSYFYLTDHLGSIRATVQGGSVLVQDDFSSGLGKWTLAQGSGFAVEYGELHANSGGENYLVSSSPKVFTEGIITVDVKNVSSSDADASIIVRYQDVNNFYLVHPYGNAITIFEKLGGTYYQRQTATLPTGTINPGTWYHLQITAEDSTLTVFWNSTQVLQWTDATPWFSGKLGFRQCAGRHVHWDNFSATTGGPGKVVAADDYDAWGYILEGRSFVAGGIDTRYKFTGKERDVESLYDYFGARYYDSRIGRWLAVDPLSEKYPAWSPYVHSAGNPERFVDVDGRVIFEALDVRLSRWYQFARSLMLSTAAGREVWQKLDDRKDIVIFIKFRVFDNPNTTGATNWESMEFNSNERGLTAFDIGDQIVTLGPSHVIRVGLSPLQLHKHSILDASQTLYHELTAHIYYYLANLLPLGLIVREEIEHDWFGDDGLLNHFDKAGNSPAAIYYRQAYVAQWKLRENWKHNTGYLSPRKRYYSYDPFSGEENYTNPEH